MVTRPAEDGAGLVELLVAAALGLLGLTVVAAVARGPIAAATAASRPQARVEGLLLLRDVVGGQVRAARDAGPGPRVPAIGPDHVVLTTVRADGAGWTRLTIAQGSLLVDGGSGSPPEGPTAVGRRLTALPEGSFVVLDADGAELLAPGAAAVAPGDRRLDTAAVVALRIDAEGRPQELAVALRPGP